MDRKSLNVNNIAQKEHKLTLLENIQSIPHIDLISLVQIQTYSKRPGLDQRGSLIFPYSPNKKIEVNCLGVFKDRKFEVFLL